MLRDTRSEAQKLDFLAAASHKAFSNIVLNVCKSQHLRFFVYYRLIEHIEEFFRVLVVCVWQRLPAVGGIAIYLGGTYCGSFATRACMTCGGAVVRAIIVRFGRRT